MDANAETLDGRQGQTRSRKRSAPDDPQIGEKSELARRDILDTAVACFADLGWGGTNMSVIARRSRMTRSRIQYYFPTLGDLFHAAIEHLMIEWRRKYFGTVAQVAGVSARFETGIEVLWRLMRDPLHWPSRNWRAAPEPMADCAPW